MTKKFKIRPKRKFPLWLRLIISIPLVVSIMWTVMILSVYNEIPLVYEQASPSGINTLLILIVSFAVSYGAFIFIEYRKTLE